VRVLLGVSLAALLAGVGYAAIHLAGHGAREAVGERGMARSGDVEVVYYAAGPRDGAVVVLFASLARPVSDFNELVTALDEAGHRTLGVESRGIGGSDGGGLFGKPSLHDLAADALAVLDAEGVGGTVHVVGHAFGNRVARTFAADHPERTRSVTLVAAGGRAPIAPRIERALFLSTLAFLPDRLRLPELRLAFFADPERVPGDWVDGWSLWGAMAQIHAARSADSGEFWGAGFAPMLVIQALEDTIAPPDDAGRPLKAEFPERVTLVELRDAGHALLPEQPARIRDAVLGFLRDVDA
jgi:pimeloyl-ACP methyl ester carboxylesterase